LRRQVLAKKERNTEIAVDAGHKGPGEHREAKR
jgi:hypothetical protein